MTDGTELLTNLQMGEADRLAILGGVPGQTLMDNAGGAVARAVIERFGKAPVLVLCGPGNNGGDGFVAARHLARQGWSVRVGLLGEPGALRGDAGFHARMWSGAIDKISPGLLSGAALVIDALFGSGLSRPIDGVAKATLRAAAEMGLPIVAVDVPSGLNGDTGEDWGAARAALTVTFFRKKPGHMLLPGRLLCGETMVADIGTPLEVLTSIGVVTHENTPSLWRQALPRPAPGGNKYGRGHALVYGGAVMTGAARMAARAAARAGAGLTTVAAPERAWPVYAASLTSIMVRPLPEPETLDDLVSDTRITAMLIGPGAGAGDQTRAHALCMLRTRRAVLLDADALTCFQHAREALFAAIDGSCVMTPHDGEFGRLFDEGGDRLTRARAAAARSGAVIVLKGADSVVAAPDGRASINANAPETLATAGSGDVLGGIILGLLAQGMEPFLAACAGVWMHGESARLFGPGLIAEDLTEQLPLVWRGLY
jgi:NAD(P)H-hydrate epimerase